MNHGTRSGPHGRRRRPALLLLAASLLVVLPAGSTQAAPSPVRAAAAAPVVYAALGDSYSAGLGTDQAGAAPCLRSPQAYPQLWTRRHASALTFLACSGAWIGQVALDQVPRIPADATQVTVTMGGNDVGFAAVIGACTIGHSELTCRIAVALARSVAVTEVPVALGATLLAIRHRAPHARVVVLGYPRLFGVGPCPAGVPGAAERAAVDAGTDLLDGAISNTSRLLGARFVDVRARFTGHGVCAPAGRAWINGPDAGAGAYHPDDQGQSQGYLAALTAVTG